MDPFISLAVIISFLIELTSFLPSWVFIALKATIKRGKEEAFLRSIWNRIDHCTLTVQIVLSFVEQDLKGLPSLPEKHDFLKISNFSSGNSVPWKTMKMSKSFWFLSKNCITIAIFNVNNLKIFHLNFCRHLRMKMVILMWAQQR